MSNSLSRFLSSVSNLSTANDALRCTISHPPTPSASASVTRFICSTTLNNPVKEQAKASKENLTIDDTRSQEEKQEEDEDEDVNKETGEVGGSKGPEPTRYGDWERNGRCYDF